MRWFAILLLVGLAGCGKQAGQPVQKQAAKSDSASVATAQSTASAQPAAMETMIPVPKDKAQLDRMLAMGYTVHEDHMHPPGVKECPMDKAAGSVVQ